MKHLLALIISGALAVSGYSQTRNVLVNSNNAVVSPTNFWSVDASNARTGLGLGTAATNPASAFQPSSATLSNLASSNAVNLTNLRATNIVGVIPASNISSLSLTNISGTLAISNGGSGATTASGARTNFELGATWLTNTVVSDFRTAIGLPLAALTNTNASNFRVAIGATTIGNALFTATNSAAAIDAIGISTNFSDQVLSVSNIQIGSFPSGSSYGFVTLQAGQRLKVDGTNVTTSVPAFYGFNGFESTAFSAAQARTNLGLNTWTTNTNSPVFVGTNGEVVSPTNFWQVAPIVAQFIESQPTTNSTTNITGARLLHIHSLATNIVNVTNTIALPTNGTSFAGDIALVVHQGPTNSMTRVRQAGSTNDLITMTRFDEAVELVYYENEWQLNHNVAFVEPIYFAGTNAAANAAASRTNLGLGSTNSVAFADIEITKTGTNSVYAKNDAGSFQVQIGTNAATFAISTSSVDIVPPIIAYSNVSVDGNVDVVGTLSVTSTVTAKTNLVVEGFVDFTTNRAATNGPTNAGNFNTHAVWITIKAGTNTYFLPAYK